MFLYPNLSKGKEFAPAYKFFSGETLPALKVNPDLEVNDGTVKFIAIFIEFWKIINVYIPYANIRLRDLNRAIIRTPNDEKLEKVMDMSNFVKEVASKV